MNKFKKHPSAIQTISLLLPALILVGCYLILKGHISPGGGFQGGAALAAVLISHYMIVPTQDIDMNKLQNLEKYIFLIFVICACLYILMGFYWTSPESYEAYIIAMNALIGIKVFCGLSLLFFEFAIEDN